MKQELPDPRDAIIARQAIEIEQIKRDHDKLVDRFISLNPILDEARKLADVSFMPFR